MASGEEGVDNQENKSIESLRLLLAKSQQKKAELYSRIVKIGKQVEAAGTADPSVDKCFSLIRTQMALASRESALRSRNIAKRAELELDVQELEGRLSISHDQDFLTENLDQAVESTKKKIYLSKKKLALKLRTVLALRQQIDEMATQAEVDLFSSRFAEINAVIQEKHQQTKKYFDTYNALLDIKNWMLKEISLLDSISNQFHDAVSNTESRIKLIASMEQIEQSTRQKLQKVVANLQE